MMNYGEPYGNIRKIKIGERGGRGAKGGFCFLWNLAKRARTLHLYTRNFLISGRVRTN
jgi:hypothetical protein